MRKTSPRRILLKLSGELLAGEQSYGIDWEACEKSAQSIKRIKEEGFEVAIVIGGGNIFRGINLRESQMERAPADHMGMLGTMMNGIALQQALASMKCRAKVMSALECPKVAEPFRWHQAALQMEEGTVLIFVGGTGNPYFTTDTAAALRASEIRADLLLKATKVNGVFDKDPVRHPDAKRYETISYKEAIAKNLGVMDATSFALCMSNRLPIFVFNMEMLESHTLKEILSDREHGTFVKEAE